jgi:hypothetical protein
VKKLIFGETWVLPIGIGLAVGAAALLGGSGFVLLILLSGVLGLCVWPRNPRKDGVNKL